MLVEVEQMKAQSRAETEQAKIQANLAIQEAKMTIDREKAMADLLLQQAKIQLDREKSAIQLQLEQSKLAQEGAMMQADMMLKEREQIMGELEKAQRALESRRGEDVVVQLGQMVSQLQQNQDRLAKTMSAPKTVVRDAGGKIIGVKSGE
jgi:hypothetical protein